MPKEVFGKGHQFLRRNALLSYEEIERIARVFVDLGVKKIRLTGGEPLIRNDLESLIEKLARIDGLSDLSLTTNASLLTPERASTLREAGIQRVNVSLDALDEKTFAKINSVKFPVTRVLNGISQLVDAGFDHIKINMVVQKGLNEESILPMVDYFRKHPANGKLVLRFIEFMDVGNANDWRYEDVVTGQQIHDLIHQQYPISPIQANYLGEVAQRWQYDDGKGEVGIISSITQPFCKDCSRARLSAIGEIFHCLFASDGLPLIDILRGGISDAALYAMIKNAW